MSWNPGRMKRPLGLAALLMLLAVAASGQSDSYHILLTNDDGIESDGIQALAELLGTVGQVHLVAPCGERSGASMSVALRAELHVRRVEREGRSLGRCVDTTPAGATWLAITALAPDGGFDLVVSGINRGANVGTASHMSGTVGAAMMGALHGLPAVAASLGDGSDFEYSARFVTRFVTELKDRSPQPGIVYSINIPKATEAEISGVEVLKMGGSHFRVVFEEVESDSSDRKFRPRLGPQTAAPGGSDTEGYLADMITITPLRFDWTAYSVIEELRAWTPSHVFGR